MNVNRAGYYKWKDRQGTKNQYELNRDSLTSLLKEAHEKHKSYGYRRLATVVRNETGWLVTDNLVHKCCKFAGIKSKTKHYHWNRKGDEHKIFANTVAGKWNAKRPLELVSSDMTIITHNKHQYEWTFILDTFNNEIISSHVSSRHGDVKPYYDCLKDLILKTKEQAYPVTLHTDQGSVYSSAAFYNAHKKYNILRSMSRAGTPTDNAVIEALNGWIKAEIFSEGWLYRYSTVETAIKAFVKYYNNERPAFALQYKTPIQYKTDLGFG